MTFKKILVILFFLLLNHCVIAKTSADLAVKGVTKTVKAVTHITTCPFTDKDCF
jgi:hypothetical protein